MLGKLVDKSREPEKVKQSSSDILKKIKEPLKRGTYVLRAHAVKRQKDRQVRLPHILHVLEYGRHEQDKDYFDIKHQNWTHVIRGKTVENVDLRVVIAFHEEMAIVTVIRMVKK